MTSVLYLGNVSHVNKLMKAVVGYHLFLWERGSYSIVKLAVHTLQKYGIEEY